MTTIAEKAPDIDGFARAWRLDLAASRAKAAGHNNPDDSTVNGWIVNAPWSHPIWPNVAVLCIHLRDQPNQTQPPVKHLEGATHEIIVLALDPDHVPEIDGERLRFLQPSNFVGQFKTTDDDAAAAIIDTMVARICAGTLNPDTDAQTQWVGLFGDHCFKPMFKHGVMGTINEGAPA